MSPIGEVLRNSDVFVEEPVAAAYLFGSEVRQTTTPRSDVDVAVLLDPNASVDTLALRLRLAGKIENVLRNRRAIDVVVLDEAPIALAGEVLETGELVYRHDEVHRVRFTSLMMRMHHDRKIRDERNARERLATIAQSR